MPDDRIAELEAENARLRARLAEARDIMADIEHVDDIYGANATCPFCARLDPGHEDDCRLAAWLAQEDG